MNPSLSVSHLSTVPPNQSIDALCARPYAIFSELSDAQLEALAQRARQITRQRFGSTMRFFVPLYLSNECYNNCTYCGFSYDRDIERYTLSDKEILDNVKILVNKGFQHLLLLTGEAAKTVEMSYFERVLPLIRPCMWPNWGWKFSRWIKRITNDW